MTFYHLILLGLAAAGTWFCLTGADRSQQVRALAGLGAMALAMSGNLVCLAVGVAVMLATAPGFVDGTRQLLGLHRAASHAVMAAVLLALFMVNGAVICSATSVPLLTGSGPTTIALPPGANAFVTFTVMGVVVYAATSVCLGLYALLRRRDSVVLEVAPTSLATIGMAVGAT